MLGAVEARRLFWYRGEGCGKLGCGLSHWGVLEWKGARQAPSGERVVAIRSDLRAVSRDYCELEKGVGVFQDVETRPDAANGEVCGSSGRGVRCDRTTKAQEVKTGGNQKLYSGMCGNETIELQ